MIIVVRLGPAVAAVGSTPVRERQKGPCRVASAGALDVGDTGFEPVTFSVSGRRAPRLRQSPRGTRRAYQTPRAARAATKAGARHGPPARRASAPRPPPVAYATDRSATLSPTPPTAPIGVSGVADRSAG